MAARDATIREGQEQLACAQAEAEQREAVQLAKLSEAEERIAFQNKMLEDMESNVGTLKRVQQDLLVQQAETHNQLEELQSSTSAL